MTVRPAVEADLPAVKRLVDAHRRELGFVPLPALRRACERGWLLVAEADTALVGALNWWARRDGVVVLSNVVVRAEARGRRAGRLLLEALITWSMRHGAREITLKCPEELPANGFYDRAGFTLRGREAGKRRPLCCWALRLSSAVAPPAPEPEPPAAARQPHDPRAAKGRAGGGPSVQTRRGWRCWNSD